MTYDDPDEVADPEFDLRAEQDERRERAKSRVFWVFAVPFGLLAAIAIAMDMGMTGGIDFVSVWVLCAACIYAVFSFTVR
jgi:hypothetical protein